MRLFVAVDINDELRDRIGKIQNEFKRKLKSQSGIKWVNPELIHLTLKFLGEVEDENTELIIESLEQVCKEAKKFELGFSTVGSFGRPPKVLWLGTEKQSSELEKLVQNIEQTFEELGFEKEQRPFSPHLTIARIKDARPDRQLPLIIESFGKVDAPAVKVDAVCFYKSQLTSDGPIYTLLRKINFI